MRTEWLRHQDECAGDATVPERRAKKIAAQFSKPA
jgi:hypothetical protein